MSLIVSTGGDVKGFSTSLLTRHMENNPYLEQPGVKEVLDLYKEHYDPGDRELLLVDRKPSLKDNTPSPPVDIVVHRSVVDDNEDKSPIRRMIDSTPTPQSSDDDGSGDESTGGKNKYDDQNLLFTMDETVAGGIDDYFEII